MKRYYRDAYGAATSITVKRSRWVMTKVAEAHGKAIYGKCYWVLYRNGVRKHGRYRNEESAVDAADLMNLFSCGSEVWTVRKFLYAAVPLRDARRATA